MNYTAQHLLKLFQLRYPSVFKAEILKGEGDGEEDVGSGGDDDDRWSSEEDEEEEEDDETHRQGGDAVLTDMLRRRSGEWLSNYTCTCT